MRSAGTSSMRLLNLAASGIARLFQLQTEVRTAA